MSFFSPHISLHVAVVHTAKSFRPPFHTLALIQTLNDCVKVLVQMLYPCYLVDPRCAGDNVVDLNLLLSWLAERKLKEVDRNNLLMTSRIFTNVSISSA
jgi:hypothetical protein